MAKTILIAIIFVQAVLIAHAYITVTELKQELLETVAFVDRCEVKIEELKAIALETKNTCEQYLQDESLLMDYGNDQSSQ